MENTLEQLRVQVSELYEKYEELHEEINVKRANGSVSEICNLNSEFDETFDQFFDNVELRKKYGDWDYDENCIKFEKGNTDLESELDEQDLLSYIEFLQDYIRELEEGLNEVR